jgi:hypothetical protein
MFGKVNPRDLLQLAQLIITAIQDWVKKDPAQA